MNKKILNDAAKVKTLLSLNIATGRNCATCDNPGCTIWDDSPLRFSKKARAQTCKLWKAKAA